MRQRPSWTVPKNVPAAPASWAVSSLEDEIAPAALPPSPPSVPRLSLVPPPVGPSEADELRATIDELRADLGRATAAAQAMKTHLEVEKQAFLADREQLLEEARGAVIRLSTAIAERALGAELAASPAFVEQWTDEAIAILGGGQRVGNEVSFEGSVVEVTPAARVAAVVASLEERKAA